METDPMDTRPLPDLAWLGAHAAARLPAEVTLRAHGPLVPGIEAEVERLRSLAAGAAGAADAAGDAGDAGDAGSSAPHRADADADADADARTVAGSGSGSDPRSVADSLSLLDPARAREAGHDPALLEQLAAAGQEAYALRSSGGALEVIGAGERGLLYGFYAALLGTVPSSENWRIHAPAQTIRMLDHWDNLSVHPVMGQVERGYAGGSLFYEDGELREDLGRVEHYARLLASIGINRVALNNVNVHAREATLLTERLGSVARLAEIFRARGITVLLSVSFASPIVLGGLPTSDPHDVEVQDWWRTTAESVYAAIPDFGGFVVKADSEGQPGPFAYGRDHADGANMLARSLAPHGGEVFWRAFVYDHHQDWRDRSTDRARAAHDHFAPLDGSFDDNVILQVKHGPMDFQVREPVSPVLGAMPRTRLAVELQVTQEYTGQQKHICYLAPAWSEYLRFPFGPGTSTPDAPGATAAQERGRARGKGAAADRTGAAGTTGSAGTAGSVGTAASAGTADSRGPAGPTGTIVADAATAPDGPAPLLTAGHAGPPTVAQLVAGATANPGGVVAVSNVGDDEFWTGHPLAQANLFALGRLAWDGELDPEVILEEWIAATFGSDPLVREVLHELMSDSWQRYESCTAPLGVGFMVRPGHHYGPDVDGYEYTPWGTYHFADREGIGVDRTVATGTGYAGQYPQQWASLYESVETCPDELLLFFHHVPYTHRLHSGKTVIQHIYDSRADAWEQVHALRPRWQQLAGRVPRGLHERVTQLLLEQERSTTEWRDQLRSYFHRASGIPDETGRPIY